MPTGFGYAERREGSGTEEGDPTRCAAVSFNQCTAGDRLAERFHLPAAPELLLRYNIAPGQPVGAVRSAAASGREGVFLR